MEEKIYTWSIRSAYPKSNREGHAMLTTTFPQIKLTFQQSHRKSAALGI